MKGLESLIGESIMKYLCLKISLALLIVVLLTLFTSGCSFHAETSAGLGRGSKHAAAMSGRQGADITFPGDATSFKSRISRSATRDARD